MAGRKILGTLLVAVGAIFLLFGIRVNFAYLTGGVEKALAALNALTGASLVTAGTRCLTTWSRGRLAAWWLASFMLVYSSYLFPLMLRFILPPLLVVANVIPGTSRRSSLLVPMVLLGAAVAILVLLIARRRRREASATMSPARDARTSRKVAFLRVFAYVGLPILGGIAWFLVPIYLADIAVALCLRSSSIPEAAGLWLLVTSPIGLVVGVVAGLWASAASDGRSKESRCCIGVVLLLVLPVLLGLALF